MKTPRRYLIACLLLAFADSIVSQAQSSESDKVLSLGQHRFELHNVTGEVVKFGRSRVLKIERDLKALPFDSTKVEKTVDEPHYARLVGFDDFDNGTIEVKVFSQLKQPAPYSGIAGFIGVYFRIQPADAAFEGIYLRPKVGRSANQLHRNRAVQYISYPHYKFDSLRKVAPFRYEGSAPVALGEWITMRLEINGESAELFINDLKYSSFIVDKMLGKHFSGGIGLYVDIGTIGFFKDLKVTRRPIKQATTKAERMDGI